MDNISYLDEHRPSNPDSVQTSYRLRQAFARLTVENIGPIGEETLRQDELLRRLDGQPINDAGLTGDIQRS